MPVPMPVLPRRIPHAVRRRVEVHAAMAWQSLVQTHARHGLELVRLLAPWLGLDDILDRYIQEMDIVPAMAPAVRNRILVALEAADEGADPEALDGAGGATETGYGNGRLARFRPAAVVREFRQRFRQRDERDRILQLSLARAEEAIILTHIENAATLAALLEPHMSLDRAVLEYSRYLSVTGARAQAVLQRTMARLAEDRLPPQRNAVLRPAGEQAHHGQAT